MNNKQKLDSIFIECLGINESQLNDDLSVMSVECWDSIMQMRLVSEIEDAFGVMFDPEDIIELTSYKSTFLILRKLGIQI